MVHSAQLNTHTLLSDFQSKDYLVESPDFRSNNIFKNNDNFNYNLDLDQEFEIYLQT